MLIATDIKTTDWNHIIEYCLNDGWSTKFKYNGFDAGIDFDLVILKRGVELIFFGWDNWFEGEMKCTERRMKLIARSLQLEFKFGDPINLKQEVIDLFYKPPE